MKIFRESLMETGKIIFVNRNWETMPLYSTDIIREAQVLSSSFFINGSSDGVFGSEEETVVLLESKLDHLKNLNEKDMFYARMGYDTLGLQALSFLNTLVPITLCINKKEKIMFLTFIKLYFVTTFIYWICIYFSEDQEEGFCRNLRKDEFLPVLLDFSIGYLLIFYILLPLYILLEIAENVKVLLEK